MRFKVIENIYGPRGERTIIKVDSTGKFRYRLYYNRKRRPGNEWMWVSVHYTDDGDVITTGYAGRMVDAESAARNWCIKEA
ncbi:hypothetical protein [Caudoviricetes sp.]|nr:hypothetical protein [Caudoviricetes sp.]